MFHRWDDNRGGRRGDNVWGEWNKNRSRGNELSQWDGAHDAWNSWGWDGWKDDRSGWGGEDRCGDNGWKAEGDADQGGHGQEDVALAEPTQPQSRTQSFDRSSLEDEAAVAGNNAQTEGYDADYFINYQDWKESSHWTLHNASLKWHRDSGERRGLDVVFFSNTRGEEVPVIAHPPGMHYSLPDETNTLPWTWQAMIAQLDDADIAAVAGGSRLMSCRLQKTEMYDHKRHKALGSKGPMLMVWDFFLDREDGSCLTLHPNWSNTWVECKFSPPVMDHRIPVTGKGGSDGKGSYKGYVNRQLDASLRFDAQRPKRKPQSRIKAPPLPPPKSVAETPTAALSSTSAVPRPHLEAPTAASSINTSSPPRPGGSWNMRRGELGPPTAGWDRGGELGPPMADASSNPNESTASSSNDIANTASPPRVRIKAPPPVPRVKAAPPALPQ